MKGILFFPAILLTLSSITYAAEVLVGNNKEEVIAILGAPTSYMKMGGSEYLHYKRGLVTLESNLVVTVAVESEEAYLERLARERKEQKEALEKQKHAEAERYQAGMQLKASMLSSSDYLVASAEQQVKWWKAFAKKYPRVDIKDPYLAALKQYEIDKMQSDEIAQYEQRIKNLEQRLENSEWERKEAERVAEEKNALWPQQTVQYREVVPYYHQPLIVRKSYHANNKPACYVTKKTARKSVVGGGLVVGSSSSGYRIGGSLSSGTSGSRSIYSQFVW